jgi:hypothetical protein
MEQTMEWQVQKMCTDVHEYELTIEKQKKSFHCEQPHGSWKWMVHYHGASVATGVTNDAEQAKQLALANVPA